MQSLIYYLMYSLSVKVLLLVAVYKDWWGNSSVSKGYPFVTDPVKPYSVSNSAYLVIIYNLTSPIPVACAQTKLNSG